MSAPHFPPLALTPADVYPDRREEILQRRKEQEQTTIYGRFQYNLGQS